ncbi:30S ribosomal protein S9 [Candidatus Daviesbacteria bacterium RIFCSPLOWO2_01_FULL_43_38]|uniref:30S ribosomal protein S9 n=2 Tax=Candidatus Daviesiibacteriota TaxID=1752718 RepID=A0A1F5K7X3_9BACT|nr:MAG: 30S ribosomal protein S9 [Candidatus Daviesbacteria bacterium GW2011_GWA2_42_7]OGE20393.1 MAG: 30S ribosomal protein S9 [Candidatus Daviesbacteria bacterium RIFCSPHIGHO2_01_FULL_43_17]OGE36999.1 MAG: 30S ribosomal protein S9 [Candidatus Daviesbacteria bacterium RIFCSPHIGHO2_12_FULL_43_11]OGE63933.1 MAG: 30S ribosomal protein S9 [Candidatus Daviesbacteria bacterium RIFCSPLOWO2_01_FULL_43_38]OGE69006.1 MAG: 30S ribosomal protein S9 [Candidatus Daviesbacteria bacterium RIFCSPLOWO2_02_FULL_
MVNNQHNQSVGRRKEAVARVRVMEGNSPILVNGKPISEVYRGVIWQKTYQKPFELTKTLGKFTATIKVVGGGTSSQLGAIVHGLSRSLAKISAENKAALKKHGLLTRDPRAKERRKYGLAHAARAKKSSPKR